MKLSTYLLRGGDGVAVPRRMLVLVTDAQGRTWRAVIDEGTHVEDHAMSGPIAPTYSGAPPGSLLDSLKRGPVAQGS